jgi:hypothetical protein
MTARHEGITVASQPLPLFNPDYGDGENGTLDHSHMYYIKSVDVKDNKITLGNPWGYDDAVLTEAQFRKDMFTVYANPLQ